MWGDIGTNTLHLAGKMGKASDPMAVVDSHGKVFGVKGLRVVDASAFPFLPPGNPQSIVCKLFFLCNISATQEEGMDD